MIKHTTNNRRIAKTRRTRGYVWEDTLVKRFRQLDDWHAFRLGSPSTGLPDIIAINNIKKILIVGEAKSGTADSLQVPSDQIIRCINTAESFTVYKKRIVLLAFKFISKRRIGVGQYEHRELREFYKIWDMNYPINDCTCTYDGDVYEVNSKRQIKIDLKNYKAPFL